MLRMCSTMQRLLVAMMIVLDVTTIGAIIEHTGCSLKEDDGMACI